MKHLVTDISGHGLGHLAQAAPVVSRLMSMVTGIRLTIRSSLPENLLRTWINTPFDYVRTDPDRGMIMHDAITVDVEASCAWYESFHADYEKRLKGEILSLEILRPDLLLSDIPWIGLESAHRLGIPSVALCSLNWSDIYRHYCHRQKTCDEIAERILSAYACAHCFLQPEPAMPMPELDNTRQIPPIARVGQASRNLLHSLAETRDTKRFILLSLGGIGMQFPPETLPVLQDTVWIVPDTFETDRNDVIAQSSLGMRYIDLLASVDLVVTKTGYGALVEAVVNRTPVLCIKRPGWPEERGLFDWCKKHGYFESIGFQDLASPAANEIITSLMQIEWKKETVVADGDRHAAKVLSTCLHQT